MEDEVAIAAFDLFKSGALQRLVELRRHAAVGDEALRGARRAAQCSLGERTQLGGHAAGAVVGACAVGHGEHRDASRPQQAEDLGQRALVAQQVLEHAEGNHGVEQAVGEAGGFGIGDREMAATAARMVGHALAATLDHLRAEVDAPELARRAEQRIGHHCRTAADVQHALHGLRQQLQRDAPLGAERELLLSLARIVVRARVEVATDLRGLVGHADSLARRQDASAFGSSLRDDSSELPLPTRSVGKGLR